MYTKFATFLDQKLADTYIVYLHIVLIKRWSTEATHKVFHLENIN